MPKNTRPLTKLHRNPVTPPDWSAYGMHLTRYDIDRVLHHTHWIPNLRGFTAKFFEENYPGWDLPGFMTMFRTAGILLNDGVGSPHGGRCHWQLKCLHFQSVLTFAVEWDESVTADDGRFYFSGRPDESGIGAFTLPAGPQTDIAALARRAFELLTSTNAQGVGEAGSSGSTDAS